MCGRCPDAPQGDLVARAAARCTLTDFDPSRWDPNGDPDTAAEAEHAAGDLVGFASRQGIDLDYELERDGCAWGWVVCGYSNSVLRYVGQRSTKSPIRQYPPRMIWQMHRAAVEPKEIFEAVELVEAYEDGCFALLHEIAGERG